MVETKFNRLRMIFFILFVLGSFFLVQCNSESETTPDSGVVAEDDADDADDSGDSDVAEEADADEGDANTESAEEPSVSESEAEEQSESAVTSETSETSETPEDVAVTSEEQEPSSTTATITQLVAGGSHNCVLYSDGIAKCWGNNLYGQLGNGTNYYLGEPVTVEDMSTVSMVAAGSSHTCGLLSDGTARCWGLNTYGQLGDGSTTSSSIPVSISEADINAAYSATAIVSGSNHSCAVMMDGDVQCWGLNTHGQLGNASTTNSSTPVLVSGLHSVASIAAGSSHTCALISDGTVKCWGHNAYGQLGNGSTTSSSTPVSISEADINAAFVVSGANHSCAVMVDGDVQCWGLNTSGQLGNGLTTNSSTPVLVPGLHSVASMAAGSSHTCALISDGTVKCWGYNHVGQLGDGTHVDSTSPITVSGISTATAIAADSDHTCALLSDGIVVKCWGNNYEGQLGDGRTEFSVVPLAVPEVSMATMIGTSPASRSCAVINDGTVKCWGDALDDGFTTVYFGDGATPYYPTPAVVSEISSVTKVALGTDSICVLLEGGTVECWGQNNYGQLGNGTTTNSNTPVSVQDISTAASIASGGFHACALLTDGTVRCWGWNAQGQLGDASTDNASIPVVVFEPTINTMYQATQISAGGSNTCVLMADGRVQCWGSNTYGQLGDGSAVGDDYISMVPVYVSELTGATAVSVGSGHACALISGGTVKCWGLNDQGQLGNGTTTNSNTPVSATGLSSVTGISAGNDGHTCAVISDGRVQCWGDNQKGQLGDGTLNSTTTAVDVSGITTATAVLAGTDYSCALLNDGTLECWGANDSAQLGDGYPMDSSTPVEVGF